MTTFTPHQDSALKAVADWLKANGEAVKAFLDWSAKYQWPSAQ